MLTSIFIFYFISSTTDVHIWFSILTYVSTFFCARSELFLASWNCFMFGYLCWLQNQFWKQDMYTLVR